MDRSRRSLLVPGARSSMSPMGPGLHRRCNHLMRQAGCGRLRKGRQLPKVSRMLDGHRCLQSNARCHLCRLGCINRRTGKGAPDWHRTVVASTTEMVDSTQLSGMPLLSYDLNRKRRTSLGKEFAELQGTSRHVALQPSKKESISDMMV